MFIKYVKDYQIKTDFNCATNSYITYVANVNHNAKPTPVGVSFTKRDAKTIQNKWVDLAKIMGGNNELVRTALALKPVTIFKVGV